MQLAVNEQVSQYFALAQDEASCVVYGMPKAAYDIGAAEEMVPLDQIAQKLIDASYTKSSCKGSHSN